MISTAFQVIGAVFLNKHLILVGNL